MHYGGATHHDFKKSQLISPPQAAIGRKAGTWVFKVILSAHEADFFSQIEKEERNISEILEEHSTKVRNSEQFSLLF